MAWLRRIRLLLTRRRDAELREEMAAHREMLAAERGLSPAEAERAFGNELLLRERARDILGWRWVDDFGRDLRYGVGQIRRNPGFAAAAVLTLALGIGATTAMFSVVNGVVLNPLPYPQPDRLVAFAEELGPQRNAPIAYPDFLDWERLSGSFASFGAYRHTGMNLTGTGTAEHLSADQVSAGFFPTLGVQPILGRTFSPKEDHPGAANVVVLGNGLWKSRFASSPAVIGQTIRLDDQDYTVIGVLPSGFYFCCAAQGFVPGDVYLPIGANRSPLMEKRGVHPGIFAIGRLKPGVTLERAQADIASVAQHLAEAYPATNTGEGITLTPLKQRMVGNVTPILLRLLVAVGLVLLIACANVAGLFLARAAGRTREFAIRAVLGAGRGRLVRQLLTESVLLAFFGGAFGLLLAWMGTRGALARLVSSLPRAAEVGLDGHVLAFAMGASVVAGLLFGLAPAWQSGGARQRALNSAHGTRFRGGTRNVLVGAEIGLAVVLLVSAGLNLRSLAELWNVNLGFDPHNVSTFGVVLPPSLAKSCPNAIRGYLEALSKTVAAVPGVQAASITYGAFPLQGGDREIFLVEGRPWPASSTNMPDAWTYSVGQSGYFRALHIPLLSGRLFQPTDDAHSQPVVIIGERLARTYFPHQNPIGGRLHLEPNGGTYQIVGVVGHVHQQGLIEDARTTRPQLYLLSRQFPDAEMPLAAHGASFVVRTRSPTFASIASIRRAVEGMNRDQVAYGFASMHDSIAAGLASRQLTLSLFGIFAVLALALTAVGIYGVVAYTVASRTREIGIRMALGAERRDILGQVVGEGLRLALIGVGAGLAGALVLTRFLSSQLYGVRPYDPLTFASVATLLVAVALAACYIPARRAARADPMVALRYE